MHSQKKLHLRGGGRLSWNRVFSRRVPPTHTNNMHFLCDTKHKTRKQNHFKERRLYTNDEGKLFSESLKSHKFRTPTSQLKCVIGADYSVSIRNTKLSNKEQTLCRARLKNHNAIIDSHIYSFMGTNFEDHRCLNKLDFTDVNAPSVSKKYMFTFDKEKHAIKQEKRIVLKRATDSALIISDGDGDVWENSRSRNDLENINIMLHGTWNTGLVTEDMKPRSLFWANVSDKLHASQTAKTLITSAYPGLTLSFMWSGKNNDDDRIASANRLKEHIDQLKEVVPHANVNIFAHSHGCTVVKMAIKQKEAETEEKSWLHTFVDFSGPDRAQYRINNNSMLVKRYLQVVNDFDVVERLGRYEKKEVKVIFSKISNAHHVLRFNTIKKAHYTFRFLKSVLQHLKKMNMTTN